MKPSEFMRQLDNLYDAMDLFKEKLELRRDFPNIAIIECAQHILGEKVKELIDEYFNEVNQK